MGLGGHGRGSSPHDDHCPLATFGVCKLQKGVFGKLQAPRQAPLPLQHLQLVLRLSQAPCGVDLHVFGAPTSKLTATSAHAAAQSTFPLTSGLAMVMEIKISTD